MARLKSISRVVWAVDAFDKSSALRRGAIQSLRAVAERTGASVEPVYVLTPAELNLSIEFTPAWVEQYRPAAEQALKQLVDESSVPNLLKPVVIIQNSGSTKTAVRLLCQHARETGASAIVAATHGREGMSRVFLGSFAETLILQSTVPVIVSPPDAKPAPGFGSFLFPTDLGPGSRALFEYTVELARQFNAELTLFHALPNPIEPIFQSGVYLLGGGWVPIHNYFSEESDRRRKQIEAWVEWAESRQVRARSVVQELSGNVADTILSLAEEGRHDLIVMGARTGGWAAALVGSTTRQVVRHSPAPVWILHPADVAARKTRAA